MSTREPPPLARQESVPVVAMRETFSCLRVTCVAILLPLCLTLFLKVNNSWTAHLIAVLMVAGTVFTMASPHLATPTHTSTAKARAETNFDQHGKKYFAFISHSKRETGTEASLIYDAIKLRYPSKDVFLDSKELHNLQDLLPSVANSRFFVVLLSPGYVTRPHCMAEFLEARAGGLDVVTVNVSRLGVDAFDFDKVGRMAASKKDVGALFDAAGWRVLDELGFSPEDVAKALRDLVTIKAFAFHPHEAPNVRAAELENVYAALRKADAKE